MGLTLDAAGFGLGTRSQRYALMAEDGVVSPGAGAFAPCWKGGTACSAGSQQLGHCEPCSVSSQRHQVRLCSNPSPRPVQIKNLWVEPGPGLSCSSAEAVLEVMK